MSESNEVEVAEETIVMSSGLFTNTGELRSRDRQECLPLKTLSEIWSWRKESWPNLVVEFSPRISLVVSGDRLKCGDGVLPRVHKDSVPRTIFCHDLKGGYLEDR